MIFELSIARRLNKRSSVPPDGHLISSWFLAGGETNRQILTSALELKGLLIAIASLAIFLPARPALKLNTMVAPRDMFP